MKAVKRKLKSGAGASILISLMFFLVVMMVGVVCLVAAYNNSGRATHAKDDLQRYYAVQSAINLIQEDMKKDEAEFIFTQADGHPNWYSVEIPESNQATNSSSTENPRYGKLVYDLIKSTFEEANEFRYEPSDIQGASETISLTVSGTGENAETAEKYNKNLQVSGSITLGTKIMSNPNDIDELDFSFIVELWVDNNGTKTYATTLTFPAYVREVNVYNANDETVTTKLYVTWDSPQTGRREA